MIPPLPPRFLNWRLEPNPDPEQPPRKVPCTRDGRKCDAHDQANHLTYEQAAAAGYGVAYAMRAEDGWFFLDLDKCLVDGKWTADAVAIFTSFTGAWGEVSQSGNGLHILGRCRPGSDKRMLVHGKPDLVVAFPGGKGTWNMCEIARRAGVEVRVVQ